MPPTRDERRVNRKHVLESLLSETGSAGGDAAADRVRAYCKDPVGASTIEFGFVGGLTLTRFYVDPSKPNKSEARSLWQEMTKRLAKPGAADPGGWDGSSAVKMLHAIVEEAE
jgi:hypothetical protein